MVSWVVIGDPDRGNLVSKDRHPLLASAVLVLNVSLEMRNKVRGFTGKTRLRSETKTCMSTPAA